jgi:hypothetical protein
MPKRPSKQELLIYAVLGVCIVSLLVSSYTLYELKKATQPPRGITTAEFLAKLTAHDEAAPYKGVMPLNIIRIDSSNLPGLQAQISGLDVSFIGSYIVQYKDRIFIYSIQEDKIRGNIPLVAQQPRSRGNSSLPK